MTTLDCSKINLRKGNKNDEVKKIQEILEGYGYYEANNDGNYGNYTVDSIKRFQKDVGITVDGWVGSETCKALQKYQTLDSDLKKGSVNVYVKIVQNRLKQLGYYTGTVDGKYGTLTFNSVKKYQSKHNLLQDGVVGKVTYKSLITNQNNSSGTNKQSNTKEYTIFTNTKLCEKQGGDCLGQVSSYHCGPHSIKQCLRRFGITGYSERTIGGYAGTTTAGTGHYGLETAIAHIAKLEGIQLKVKWVNFSDLGNTDKERFKRYGELMTDEDKAVFHHELYRNRYGHYSILKQTNTNNNNLIVANSLGSKCKSPAYCGYMENRSFNTMQSYFNGISQKSICIITKV